MALQSLLRTTGRFRATPRIQPDFAHPILRAQSCWYVANDKNTKVRDILGRTNAVGTMGTADPTTAMSFGATPYGAAWKSTGAATGFITFPPVPFIASDTQPFTIAWIEQTNSNASMGICNLVPGGGSTTPFMVLRLSQLTIGGTSAYGACSCGPWKTGGSLVGWLADANNAPPLTAVAGAAVVIIITGAGGPISQTPGDYTLYCGGQRQNFAGITAVASGNTGAVGTLTNNFFGWDNGDAKWLGLLDNLRIWNRVLSRDECRALCINPYTGALPFRAPRTILAPFKPWTAMPTGWPS